MSKFQQQMQQQQRMMGGKAWMDRQQRERERLQGMAPPAQRTGNQFDAVEDEAYRLRQEFDTQRITAEQLEARLKELMVQDASGNWWMVGSRTGGWYRYDGVRWIPDTPPHRAGARRPAVMGGSPSKTRGGLGRGLVALFNLAAGLFASVILYTLVGTLTYAVIPEEGLSLITAVIAGLIGLVWTFRRVRNAWNG